MSQKKIVTIELFSGAGGLSEGFLQTGLYEIFAHVEWEMAMVNTLRNNLEKRWGYKPEEAHERVVNFDVQKVKELVSGGWSLDSIVKYGKNNSKKVIDYGINGLLAGKKVDLVIGGPPCQAYSLAGRAQDPNSMKSDYRNYLFESFVEIVDYYRPKAFVFENVPGILSAKPGDEYVIQRIFKSFEAIGYEIRNSKEMKESLYMASHYGVPQDRKRIIIIGVDKNSSIKLSHFYEKIDSLRLLDDKKTVRDAIGNLPKFKVLNNHQKIGKKNVSHKLVGEKKVPYHSPRYHNKRDIEIFKNWLNNKMNDKSSLEKLEFYNKYIGKSSNHIKYRNLEWDKASPTIVAHLQKDGLMFIHPDKEQLRSITIAEASLLQSFPKDFEFKGSNAQCYKMIGNAVPVLFAKKIGLAVGEVMKKYEKV